MIRQWACSIWGTQVGDITGRKSMADAWSRISISIQKLFMCWEECLYFWGPDHVLSLQRRLLDPFHTTELNQIGPWETVPQPACIHHSCWNHAEKENIWASTVRFWSARLVWKGHWMYCSPSSLTHASTAVLTNQHKCLVGMSLH